MTSLLHSVEGWRIWRTRVGQWLKSYLGIGRRWGIRFENGQVEKTGFCYRLEAEDWLEEQGLSGVVFYYEPLDLRALPSTESTRNHYTGS